MPLPHGIAWLSERLAKCQTTDDLKKLWGSISYAYQREALVQAAKDKRKQELQRAGK